MPSRRDFCAAVPALALLLEAAGKPLGAQIAAQATAPPIATAPHAESHAEPDPGRMAAETALLQHNQIFRTAGPLVHTSANGSTQHVVQGTLVTGEGVELHNSTLLPGHEPHPPHRHVHAEFLLIREGNVEWLLDGKRQPAGPGDILYAASEVLHGLRNTGTVTATYFVVAIGPNLKTMGV